MPDLAGPQEEDLVDMARRVVQTRRVGTRVLPLPPLAVPAGGLLPGPEASRGRSDFAGRLAAGE